MTNTDTRVIDTRNSIAAKAQIAPYSAVHLTDKFWEPRLRINRDETIPSQYLQLIATGCIDNFLRAAGKKDVPFQGVQFADTDLYKWLEAACSVLASHDDPDLATLVESSADLIAGAQQPDGYLDTYYMFERAGERWSTINTGFNNMHEMYTAGHFFQAAVAHHRATGSTKLLDVATRLASHIADTFGPEEDKKHGVDAHPEVEMGLVELFRITGNRRFLEAAQYQLDTRLGMGRMNTALYPYLLIREYDRVMGHAVCAVYLMAGAADTYAETGDESLRTLLGRIWDNMTQKQMYITGGIGPRWDNEAFGADYELPGRAYAETCASIGSIMWNARMLAIDPDPKYADIIEQTLYNAFLSGLSLDGKQYFYENVLSDDGTQRRTSWFRCACCPPNAVRLLAQLPGYFYAVSKSEVLVNLYGANQAELTLPDGQTVSLTQKTNYPWDGRVQIEVETAGAFALNLRIPAWARGAQLSVNGDGKTPPAPGTYAKIEREWKAGDVIELDLPMPVRQVVAHPAVGELASRTALVRGPLVYCFEQADNPGIDIRKIQIAPGAKFETKFEDGLLNGIVALHGSAVIAEDAAWDGKLYRDADEVEKPALKEVEVIAVPYYAWANREAGAMTVWVGR